ncbi:MAG: helix-turn-helix domain-containing protein [Candidatus Aenigmarchaeota archaeon]|nr:helix-turn-helix domain-containing protein [Candidatus Aenigmarchaeota archaeon]MBU5688710.1 helix-turn-helix domain-containing protein [Candidatus Aenigmarchaeota archaeon]
MSDPKQSIIELLKKHPEGLTLQKIAQLTNMNRLTATKYVHELIGAGIIYQRKVGVAKLCYLKERYVKLIKEEEVLEKLKKVS